jgi:hypothetical protein
VRLDVCRCGPVIAMRFDPIASGSRRTPRAERCARGYVPFEPHPVTIPGTGAFYGVSVAGSQRKHECAASSLSALAQSHFSTRASVAANIEQGSVDGHLVQSLPHAVAHTSLHLDTVPFTCH